MVSPVVLQNHTRGLLFEWVWLLWAESNKETVLMLVLVDILDNVLYGLWYVDAFEIGLPSELLGDLFLLLKVGDHHVHDGTIGETYLDGFTYTRLTRNKQAETLPEIGYDFRSKSGCGEGFNFLLLSSDRKLLGWKLTFPVSNSCYWTIVGMFYL